MSYLHYHSNNSVSKTTDVPYYTLLSLFNRNAVVSYVYLPYIHLKNVHVEMLTKLRISVCVIVVVVSDHTLSWLSFIDVVYGAKTKKQTSKIMVIGIIR